MKVKFVINGSVKDEIDMPCYPKVGEYVTWGGSVSEVKEVEHLVESRGIYIKTIVRCSGDYAVTPLVSKRKES
jgi:hypothetical protein